MKVIAFLNEKGGVAKTTSVFNIATILAQRGKKVLMVDCDAQASLTLATMNDPIALRGLAEVYSGTPIGECIYQLEKIPGLYLLPSSIRLAKVERGLMSELGRERKLVKFLKAADGFDYVLIDCPPALGLLTINALAAADFLVAPTETSALSSYALEDLLDTVDELQEEINPKLKFIGVIATRYACVAKRDRKELADLEKDYTVLGVVKSSTAARAGLEDGLPTVIADKKSDVAKSYESITDRLLEVIAHES